MKVLAYVHMYVPVHNAGAEHTLHAFMRHLAAKGHQVTVVATHTPEPYVYEGVQVTNALRDRELWNRADVAITHLDMTRKAIEYAKATETPLVHLVHNHRQLKAWRVKYAEAALVIYNSRWLERANHWAGPTAVIHPPVDYRHYEVSRKGAKHLTLINLFKEKGSELFYELAERLPEHRFLAVTGAYGGQHLAERDNITLIEQTPDIVGEVYARTRVLLMPSRYESWGRTAIEAGASGIPTIAAPVPGLVESLGSAGIFANLDDPDAWEREIRRLDDSSIYLEHAMRAVQRSHDLEPAADLERFEQLITAVAVRMLKPYVPPNRRTHIVRNG